MPVAVVTVPALIVAAVVTSAGVMFVRLAVTGVAGDFQAEVAVDGPGWALLGPEMLWPLWGVALAVAAVSYRLRRRGSGLEIEALSAARYDSGPSGRFRPLGG